MAEVRSYGLPGALISGWPALAFVGSVEMVIGTIRRTRSAREDQPGLTVVPEVATSALEAARLAYAASVRGGNPLSGRSLATQFGISRNDAAG